jgi:hypothetical protein
LASLIGTTPYAIQGRSLPFDANDIVPLRFKATTAGNFIIAIDHTDGLFLSEQTVYLRDNLTGTVHNLSTGQYAFTSDAGTFDTRFEILYQNSSLGVANQTFNANGVIIYKTPTNDLIINTGNTEMSVVKIFDINGKLLLEKKDINTTQLTINVGFSTEVLLVQISSQDGVVVTKKVLFQRTSMKIDKNAKAKDQIANDE